MGRASATLWALCGALLAAVAAGAGGLADAPRREAPAAEPSAAGLADAPRREAPAAEPSAAAPPASSAPAPVDPRARLPRGDAAGEHWDLAAHFGSGHRLYLRVLVTNSGPGDHTAVAFGHVVAPDGAVTSFQNGRRQDRWVLSPDRLSLDIGSSELVLGAHRRFEVDNDKRGIEVRVEFAADGTGHAGPEGPQGYRTDLLNLATPARGRLRLGDMREPLIVEGRVALTHTWFPGPEEDHLLRRLDLFWLGTAGPRLFLSELRPPPGGGPPRRWCVVEAGGRVERVPVLPIREEGVRSGPYRYPRSLLLGPPEAPQGSVTLGDAVLDVSPLDALPALLRMVYSWGGQPRHLWADATFDVALKSPARDAVLRIQGAGAAALFFTDALPPGQP